MSDAVEPYTLYSFLEGEPETVREEVREEFVCLFEPVPESDDEYPEDKFGDPEEEREAEGPAGEAAPEPEPPVDVEAESRKIFEEAFAQGEKAGHEMGLQRVEPLAKRLTRHIAELDTFKAQLVERAEAMAVELALVFAEAVVLRSCEKDKEVVADMVRKALDICETKSEVIIRVRPDDAQYISGDGTGSVKIIPDESMREPGFVIETNFGDIDGRMSTQIEELRKRVFE